MSMECVNGIGPQSSEDNYRVKNDVEHFIYVEEYLIISSKSPRSKYHCVKIDVFETVKDLKINN